MAIVLHHVQEQIIQLFLGHRVVKSAFGNAVEKGEIGRCIFARSCFSKLNRCESLNNASMTPQDGERDVTLADIYIYTLTEAPRGTVLPGTKPSGRHSQPDQHVHRKAAPAQERRQRAAMGMDRDPLQVCGFRCRTPSSTII
jgi:hypothetical protein